MGTNKTTLYEFLSDVNKIIIPDIQRDYVLGSGKGKLDSLFKDMIEKSNEGVDFEFSCILAHRDSENNVYIYDGQQRLTTLIYLCANLCEKGIEQNEIKTLLQKFEYRGRELANEWLRNLSTIAKQEAVDFTTYSIAELMKTFEEKSVPIRYYKYVPEEKITLEFLMHKVKFDLIFIDKISDAEQFFMDVNDGLDLKDYEIYKAELYHNAKAILGMQRFKEFALKMENEWLNFFALKMENEWSKLLKKYEYKDVGYKNQDLQKKICEEERVVFFLKYCFRMMWIEEEKPLEDYRETNVSWIEEKHFIRIERILDSLIEYMSQERDKQNNDVFRINYSCPSYKMGKHWSISDENHTEMLTIFIRNLWDFKQNNKDVVMWCFLSNLPATREMISESDLNDYLRFIKKILNANRSRNEIAVMEYKDCIEKHRLRFSLYDVKDVPEYYLGYYKDFRNEENSFNDYINSIIISNADIELSLEKCYAKHFIQKCKSKELKKVLYNEELKYKSMDNKVIQEYENLPFINGLVDNFVEYHKDCCYLKEWTKKFSPKKLSDIASGNKVDQYIGILRFMWDELLFSEQLLIKNIKIFWRDYQGKIVGDKSDEKGDIVFHTWCDFFTQERELKIHNNLDLFYRDLPMLHDGWINDKYLCQIDETTAQGKKGFSAENPLFGSRVKIVFNLSSFLTNFENVCLSKETSYEINGKEEAKLPDFLKLYNDKDWIKDKLSTEYRVYYSSKRYLNQILLKMLQRDMGDSFDEYIEKNLECLSYQEIEGNRYFVKLVRII